MKSARFVFRGRAGLLLAAAMSVTVPSLPADTRSIEEMERGGELKSHEEAVEAPKDMKLILCAGQSNMAGRAAMSDEDRRPVADAYKLDRDGKWVRACAPYHFDKAMAAVGPVDEFVRLYLRDHPGEHVGVVPCAVGGSPMRDWVDAKGGVNLKRALERAASAKSNGEFIAVLWHQGETDAERRSAETIARDYPKEFAGMAAKIRSVTGDVPIILGEIGRWPRKGGADHASKINPVLNAIPSVVPKTRTVSSEGLRNQDPHHFDREGQRVLGARYYEAFRAVH